MDYATARHNLFIVAISSGFGMIPPVAPTLFRAAPEVLKPILDSGILLATVSAVLLNAFFNARVSADQAAHAAQAYASHADHA